MRQVVSRRICWPDPDATCLHGGCSYCNEHPFKPLSVIRRYALRSGVLPHRAIGEQDALEAYRYGLTNDFFNTETRITEE